MVAGEATSKTDDVEVAKLSRRVLKEITIIMQEIRLTLKRLNNLDCAPLAVMDGDAVDAIKDLYYVVSNEDPLNVQPARKLLHEQHVVSSCLLPLLAVVDSDPDAAASHKRWSVCLYHTFRALSALTTPVHAEHELLKGGCALDNFLLDVRVQLVRAPRAARAIVALLQYYVERKADKMSRFAPAEESKVEDARIENILSFFRNLLSPPRTSREQKAKVAARDVPIHLALVGVLQDADFYSTLTVLFSAKDEARGHLTKLVFLIAEIYKHTFRLSTAREVASFSFMSAPKVKVEKVDDSSKPEPSSEAEDDGDATMQNDENRDASEAQKEAAENVPDAAPRKTVFDDDYSDSERDPPPAVKQEKAKAKEEERQSRRVERRNRRGNELREAMHRERALIGGSRAISKSARWTNKHSGSFMAIRTDAEAAGGGKAAFHSKPVVAAHSAVDKSAGGPIVELRASFQLNADLLGAATATKGRILKDSRQAAGAAEVRADLVETGRRALAAVAAEQVDEGAFGVFIRELRHRIVDLVTRRTAAESEDLPTARRAFLAVVALAVGFVRERVVLRAPSLRRAMRPSLSRGAAKSAALDTCALGARWTAVEPGFELESFQLMFDSLIAFSRSGAAGAEDLMLATCALRQAMKMVQCLVLHPESEDVVNAEWEAMPEERRPRRPRLTGREFALNTLEYLFEREDYLNAPCDLAKQFDVKFHSFAHLANIVEVAHAFTATLRDEELERIKVLRKKRRRRKPKKKADKKGEEEEAGQNDGEEKDSEQKEREEKETGQNKEGKGDGAAETTTGTCEGTESFAAVGENTESFAAVGEESPKVTDATQPTDVAAKADEGESEQTDKDKTIAEAGEKEKDGGDHENGKDAAIAKALAEEEGESESEGEEQKVERSVESIGVIRRFAHSRALQVLALPLRAAFCKASPLSGALYPVPDGARLLTGAAIAAKSASVLEMIWGTSGGRDKGALRGHFFTFPLLQVLHLAMGVVGRKEVDAESVVGRLAAFGASVTRELHVWIQVNPGMALDVVLGMDKMTCQTYAHSIQARSKLLAGGYEEKAGSESDDAEGVMDEIERRVLVAARHDDDESETEGRERRRLEAQQRRAERKQREEDRVSRRRQETRRREAGTHMEDDDVDDIDALDIGVVASESEEVEPQVLGSGRKALEKAVVKKIDAALQKSKTPRTERWKKRKSMTPLELDFGNSSDEERPRPKKKPKGTGSPASGKKPRKRASQEAKRRRVTEADGDVDEDLESDDENMPLAVLADKIKERKRREQIASRRALLEADIADAAGGEDGDAEGEGEAAQKSVFDEDNGVDNDDDDQVEAEKGAEEGEGEKDADNAEVDIEADKGKGETDKAMVELSEESEMEAENEEDGNEGATAADEETQKPSTPPPLDRKALMEADIASARKDGTLAEEERGKAWRRIVVESDSE